MLNISKNKCIGCGICEKECPAEAVKVNLKMGIAILDDNNCKNCGLCIQNCPQNAIKTLNEELKIAIGTDDNKTIKANDHVGMSKYFKILKIVKHDFYLVETRENAKYKEDESKKHGDPGKAKATASALKNVDVLVGKMMGPNIQRLKNKFVPVIIREESIKEGLKTIGNYINEVVEEKEKPGQERHGLVLN
jgi:MinD superfamily P-loop ATPase